MKFEINEQTKLLYSLSELQTSLGRCSSYEEMDNMIGDFVYEYPFNDESKDALQEIKDMEIPGVSALAYKYLINWDSIQEWRK